jgi:hypothetical protein
VFYTSSHRPRSKSIGFILPAAAIVEQQFVLAEHIGLLLASLCHRPATDSGGELPILALDEFLGNHSQTIWAINKQEQAW